jgi:hypothetical protein
MIYISAHIFKAVPQLEIDDLSANGERFYLVSIRSYEPNCEIDFYFHDRRLFDEFIAQLKSQAGGERLDGAEG